jgi:hypothetical protein
MKPPATKAQAESQLERVDGLLSDLEEQAGTLAHDDPRFDRLATIGGEATQYRGALAKYIDQVNEFGEAAPSPAKPAEPEPEKLKKVPGGKGGAVRTAGGFVDYRYKDHTVVITTGPGGWHATIARPDGSMMRSGDASRTIAGATRKEALEFVDKLIDESPSAPDVTPAAVVDDVVPEETPKVFGVSPAIVKRLENPKATDPVYWVHTEGMNGEDFGWNGPVKLKVAKALADEAIDVDGMGVARIGGSEIDDGVLTFSGDSLGNYGGRQAEGYNPDGPNAPRTETTVVVENADGTKTARKLVDGKVTEGPPVPVQAAPAPEPTPAPVSQPEPPAAAVEPPPATTEAGVRPELRDETTVNSRRGQAQLARAQASQAKKAGGVPSTEDIQRSLDTGVNIGGGQVGASEANSVAFRSTPRGVTGPALSPNAKKAVKRLRNKNRQYTIRLHPQGVTKDLQFNLNTDAGVDDALDRVSQFVKLLSTRGGSPKGRALRLQQAGISDSYTIDDALDEYMALYMHASTMRDEAPDIPANVRKQMEARKAREQAANPAPPVIEDQAPRRAMETALVEWTALERRRAIRREHGAIDARQAAVEKRMRTLAESTNDDVDELIAHSRAWAEANPPRVSTPEGATAPEPGTLPEVDSPTLRSGRVPGGPQNMKPAGERNYLDDMESIISPRDDEVFKETLMRRVRVALGKAFYDRFVGLQELENTTGIPVHKAAQLLGGSTGHGESIIDRRYKPILKGIQDIWQDVETYMVMLHTEELYSQAPDPRNFIFPGGKIGNLGEFFEAKRLFIERAGPEKMKRIEAAERLLAKVNKEEVIDQLVAEGFLSTDPSYNHFISFAREGFSEVAHKEMNSAELSVGTQPLQSIGRQGSAKSLDAPLGRMLAQPVQVQSVIYRNRAAKHLRDALRVFQERGDGTEMIRPLDAGQRATNDNDWGTISLFEDGKKKVYEVPRLYADIAKGMDVEDPGMIATWARRLTDPVRRGATEFDPFFAPFNVGRDAFNLLIRENVVPLGPDWWMGMKAAFTKNTDFREFMEGGMGGGGLVEQAKGKKKVFQAERNPNKLRAALNKAHVTSNKPRFGAVQIDSLQDAMMVMPRLMSALNVNLERGSRIAVMRNLRNKGIEDIELKIRTRDSTVDFNKAGDVIRAVNMVLPFTNAATQGGANMARTLRNKPGWVLGYTTLFAGVTAGTRIHNERFETSKDIPDYEYARNWVIQFGEETRTDGTKHPLYIKFPKGEFVGAMTWWVEALFNHGRDNEDRSHLDLLLDAGIEQLKNLSPIDPTQVPLAPGLSTGVAVQTNRNLFSGAPIVPRAEEELPPGLQFDEASSSLAVMLGQKWDISPRKIDFAINDYFAGAGRNTNFVLGQALEGLGFKDAMFGEDSRTFIPLTEQEKMSKAPGMRRFFGTADNAEDMRSWERMEDEFDAANKALHSLPGFSKMGLRLDSVPADIDMTPSFDGPRFDLSVLQRVRYQQVYDELLLEWLPGYMERISETPNTEAKAEGVKKIMSNAREAAANQMRHILTMELRGEGEPEPTAEPSNVRTRTSIGF